MTDDCPCECMNNITRFFKKGLAASEAIKRLHGHLDQLDGWVQNAGDVTSEDRNKDEKFIAIQNNISNDFQVLVTVALEDENNKLKLIRKFLKTGDGAFSIEDTLVGRLLNNVAYLNGDAQRNLSQCIGFIVNQVSNPDQTDENVFAQWPKGGIELLLKKVLDCYTSSKNEASITTFSAIFNKMLEIDRLQECVFQSKPNMPLFEAIFNRCKQTNFVLATDAFKALEAIFNANQSRGATWILENYDEFMIKFIELIDSEEFVVKRQSLRLLCDIIEAKTYRQVMLKFISSKPDLKIILGLLHHKQDSIAFEAFHVFKLFLGNPKKHPEVYKTLFNNKDKLQEFLEGFQNERTEDDAFLKTKKTLLGVLDKMVDSPETYHEKWQTKSQKSKAKQ